MTLRSRENAGATGARACISAYQHGHQSIGQIATNPKAVRARGLFGHHAADAMKWAGGRGGFWPPPGHRPGWYLRVLRIVVYLQKWSSTGKLRVLNVPSGFIAQARNVQSGLPSAESATGFGGGFGATGCFGRGWAPRSGWFCGLRTGLAAREGARAPADTRGSPTAFIRGLTMHSLHCHNILAIGLYQECSFPH